MLVEPPGMLVDPPGMLPEPPGMLPDPPGILPEPPGMAGLADIAGVEAFAVPLSELVAGVDESVVGSLEPPQPMITTELHNAIKNTAHCGLRIDRTEIFISTTP